MPNLFLAFQTFDADATGKVHEDVLRKALVTWGNKFSEDEVDTAFNEAPIDRQGNIDIANFVKLICGSAKDDE